MPKKAKKKVKKPKVAGKKQATSRLGRNGEEPPAEHRWKPGQSGNPKGRPASCIITKGLVEAIEKDDGKVAKQLRKVIIDKAKAGNKDFMNILLDRTEGKVKERIDITTNDQPLGGPASNLTNEELEMITKHRKGPE